MIAEPLYVPLESDATRMPPKLNFQPVGDTHLLQSDSFPVSKDEIEYIIGPGNIVGGDIRSMIDNHQVIPLEPEEDRRIKYVFWPAGDDANRWVVDVVKPQGAQTVLPERLIEVLSTKEPIPRKKSDSKDENPVEERTEGQATIWITYAWSDNQDRDVDFIAQELRRAGLEVKLDRWNIEAGSRLWEQIERFIQSEDETDAWLLYATSNSLGSEPCKEEFAYALDRALKSRGRGFPVIGLFPGPVNDDLIPAGIRTRLYVSTTDPDWKERIKASAEGRSPDVARPELEPYQLRTHSVSGGYLLEVRPRAGTWYPFVVGVPLNEKENLGEHPIVLPGAPNTPPSPQGGIMTQYNGMGEAEGSDGSRWWSISPMGEATPAKSFYIYVENIPSAIIFGSKQGPQFTVHSFH